MHEQPVQKYHIACMVPSAHYTMLHSHCLERPMHPEFGTKHVLVFLGFMTHAWKGYTHWLALPWGPGILSALSWLEKM